MAYYENAGMLRQQFATIRALPPRLLRDLLHVVIVDDGSPHHPAVAEEIGCPLQIWRIGVDVRWNQDAARNIGVHHAETEWLLLTDMDHVVPEATWQRLLLRNYDPDVAIAFARVSAPDLAPYKPHPNSWFLTRGLFERAGGYDESFAGSTAPTRCFAISSRKSPRDRDAEGGADPLPREVIADASTTRYLRKQPEDRAGMAEC
jgi:glycosyltransferase involved in cell wall biosynthesis